MSKYTFKHKYDDGFEVQMTCEEVTLTNIVELFGYFLKGCGFEFKELEVIHRGEEE